MEGRGRGGRAGGRWEGEGKMQGRGEMRDGRGEMRDGRGEGGEGRLRREGGGVRGCKQATFEGALKKCVRMRVVVCQVVREILCGEAVVADPHRLYVAVVGEGDRP
jgi:hypothetical protein